MEEGRLTLSPTISSPAHSLLVLFRVHLYLEMVCRNPMAYAGDAMNTKTILYSGIITACAAGSLILTYWDNITRPPRPSTELASAQERTNSAMEASNAKVVVANTSEASSSPMLSGQHQNEDLAKRLQETRDYRVVFESLLRNQTPKSGLYATHILSLCSMMRTADFSKAPLKSTQQEQARQLMIDRCSTFVAEELSGTRKLELLKDPRTQGELRELRAAWNGSLTDVDQRNALLAKILAHRDQVLLEYVGPTLFIKDESGALKFRGSTYSEPNAEQIFRNAWMAAVCEGTDTECGKGDPMVLEFCANSGTCLSSRREFMAQIVSDQFGAEGVVLFNAVYPQMVGAIKAGNVSAFGG